MPISSTPRGDEKAFMTLLPPDEEAADAAAAAAADCMPRASDADRCRGMDGPGLGSGSGPPSAAAAVVPVMVPAADDVSSEGGCLSAAIFVLLRHSALVVI